MASQPISDPLDPVAVADQLATLFYGLSEATDDFRLGVHTPPLSDADKSRLKDESQALDDRAHHFTAQAITALIASIQPNLASIQSTTTDATTQLGKLQKVDEVILIATSAVALGASVATGNLKAIASAAQALGQTLIDQLD